MDCKFLDIACLNIVNLMATDWSCIEPTEAQWSDFIAQSSPGEGLDSMGGRSTILVQVLYELLW